MKFLQVKLKAQVTRSLSSTSGARLTLKRPLALSQAYRLSSLSVSPSGTVVPLFWLRPTLPGVALEPRPVLAPERPARGVVGVAPGVVGAPGAAPVPAGSWPC